MRASGTRVEELLRGFDGPVPPGRARAQAEALVASVVQLYGEALERALEIVDRNAGERADAIFAALCEDDLVGSLMAVHGLHPLTTLERAQGALETVRPYIESHQGHVEIVDFERATIRVRMSGSCHGCPSSAATLKLAIERAILEACPEIEAVEAEGVETSASSSLRVVSDWLELATVPGLLSNGHATLDVAGEPILLVDAGGTFYAYRNHCAACLHALDGATIAGTMLTCDACSTTFDVVRAGRELAGGTRALEPIPLLLDQNRLQLSIPLGT